MSLEEKIQQLRKEISELSKYYSKNVEVSYTIEAKNCLSDSCSVQPIEMKVKGLMKGFKIKLLLLVGGHQIDASKATVKEIEEKPVFFADDE